MLSFHKLHTNLYLVFYHVLSLYHWLSPDIEYGHHHVYLKFSIAIHKIIKNGKSGGEGNLKRILLSWSLRKDRQFSIFAATFFSSKNKKVTKDEGKEKE